MRKKLFIFLLISGCQASDAQTPLWNNILSSSRAINWTSVGAIGGNPQTGALPDASWPLCTSSQAGTTVPIAAYGTSAAPASPSTINTALSSCAKANPAGSVLVLGSGNFYLSAGIDFTGLNYIALRGQGANSTSLTFSGQAFCGGWDGLVCMSPIAYPQNICDVAPSSNLSQGSTTITIQNCGTTTPADGSINNLKVGGTFVIDQVDLANDNAQLWASTCGPESQTYETCAPGQQEENGGANRMDGPAVNAVLDRSMEQVVVVTSINASTGVVNFTPGLYLPTWTSAQKPQVWFPTNTQTNVGLENVLIQPLNQTYYADQNVSMTGCYSCWVSGIASLYASRAHVTVAWSDHITVQENYAYKSLTSGTQSYGFQNIFGNDTLYLSNIAQQVTDSTPQLTGDGDVAAYNFAIQTVFGSGSWFQPSYYIHAGFDHYNLWEGNIGTGFAADNIHGTHSFETYYRNFAPGWQDTCNGAACTNQVDTIDMAAGSRYFTFVNNVIGTPGFHNNYQCSATANASCLNGNTSIYLIGYTGCCGTPDESATGWCINAPSCTSTGVWDPQVATSLMRWGNWDAVNGSVQCNPSEVPSSVSPYGNSLPGACPSALNNYPPSFFMPSASKSAPPSWWGSLPFPGIGADVTGGDIGQCTGGTYAKTAAISSSECTGSGGSFSSSAYAGLVNMNPAMNCAMNVMSMPVDGSGGALSFNASTCYSGTTTTGGGGSGSSVSAPNGSLVTATPR